MSTRLTGIERLLTGLRPRLLAAMLLVSAVTLGVAALALLSPLEQRLREDGVREVQYAMLSARSRFTHLKIEPSTKLPDRHQLREVEDQLGRRTGGGEVTLLNKQMEVVHPSRYRDLNVPDYYLGASGAARRALLSKSFVRKTIAETAIVALRLKIHGQRYVLVVDKHLEYVAQAVSVVRKAFLVAAAAGLLTALLLGIGIATAMLRRLERLRDATARLERRGLDAPIPKDSGRDEIGDLSRAFAGMQSQLRRQEDARRSFVATASHELRTPLASLDGMLELLEEDLKDEALDLQDARLRTEHAREQTRRLSQLATDLLDLSRLDTEVQLRSEPVELGELARAVAAEFELSAAKREVTLAATPPQEPCWTSADPGSVARIVRILIDNALRFAPPSSSIEIAAGRDRDFAQVVVRDDGPGVPPGERKRIFERFTRGIDAASRGGGFGLGLAIGRELAIRMGGDLELLDDHEAPTGKHAPSPNGTLADATRSGAGTCFALRLPAIPAELEVAIA
ncbi:MAG TPA: HAMP domain-containing sensor histidine kinase [Solirubrobacteraceae bacterium]|nr:HAMP domain-containing sensor histidine kinase [Solirubrobacteraceae bacterium]